MIEFLLESKLYIGFIFEVIATIAGFLYLKKSPNVAPEIRVFIYYLLYIVIVEFYTFIPIYAWVHDYEVLSFYEDSVFRRSLWISNINVIVYGVCFSQVFIRSLKNMKLRAYLILFLYLFVAGSILRHFTSAGFFNSTDIYIRLVQTFFVLICIGFYYVELLKSDRVLYFHRDIKFYISVGVILWSLCVFPLDIYDDFFSLENPYFIEVNSSVIRYANVFLYSIYTIGFYMDYRYRFKSTS